MKYWTDKGGNQWYYPDEVDEEIAARDLQINMWQNEYDDLKVELTRLREALEDVRDRIPKGRAFGWTERELVDWIMRRATEALKEG